ncbi:early nodulin-like protein 9 [Bidens hawaiensis]|uniref:early nodulin-like protein 9 n=1 Tax=Bidens hawaiensis TaxID=980011 RepID=UPI00404B98FC
MANSITSHQMMVDIVAVLSLLVLIQKGDAYDFKVGGSGEWSLTASYNQWAEKNRFQVGDTLLFKYDDDKDSVLEVSKEDYDNCNTENPIAKHNDGHTVIKFDRSGPHYFISGVSDHCKNNEKLVVVVIADRSHKSPPSPSPSGSESPTPPSDVKPPSSSPNGASSVVMSLLCFMGALACFLS